MKKSTKVKILGAMASLFGAAILSGCVSNFCSEVDQAHVAYPYEQGVTIYCNEDQVPLDYRAPFEHESHPLSWQPFKDLGNLDLWAYIPVDSSGAFSAKKASFLSGTIISYATKNGISSPSYSYWKKVDEKVLDNAIGLYAEKLLKEADKDNLPTVEQVGNKVKELKKDLKATDINPFNLPDCIGNEERAAANNSSILRNFGFWKFDGHNANGGHQVFANWDKMNLDIKKEFDDAGFNGTALIPNSDFTNVYKNEITKRFNGVRTCIATRSRDEGYGHYGESANWAVQIERTDWQRAWSKGLFEGLIVYPVAALVDALSFSFDPSLSGIGQIWALILTTLIVRLVLMAITFKGTLDQQKTQALQPQIAKIQAKYPNAKENRAQQARLSQETMALYKRNKVNMFSPFIIMLVQFPVFISVWGALQGSAVLSTGEVLNLRLSDSISSVITNISGPWYTNYSGWWTALILFLLMSVLQFVAMKLPQWITKARTKNQVKLTANPTADKNNKTMKYVTYGMLIFTIIMGFALPAAMGVYWAIGALISMAQTGITQLIMAKKVSTKNERRY